MDWLNYHHLFYFWMVAREGSVTRASERLMLAQPTVSGQIKKLEQKIGHDLFDRSGRDLVLTEMGHLVHSYAERIFSVGEELLDVLRTGSLSQPSHIRIAVADALPKLVACTLIEPVLHAQSKVRVICHEGKVDQLLAELSLHAFDLVLSDAPISPTVKVRAFNHSLGECPITFFGVAGLVAKARDGFPHSLSKVPVLLPTSNTMLRRTLDRWFDEHDIHPRIVGEFEDSALLKVFGLRGAGVFPAPSIVQNEICRQYRVRVIETVEDVCEQFYAITLDRTIRNPAVSEICSMARNKLAAIDGP